MSRSGRKGGQDEFFEILVTTYSQRGASLSADAELCWRPATDVYETDDGFVVQIDLAGLEPSDIEVVVEGSSLVVRGVRGESADPGRKHFHTMEINVGPFVRRIPLPPFVDSMSASASYRAGFLCVNFRKGEPRQARRRQIAVDR